MRTPRWGYYLLLWLWITIPYVYSGGGEQFSPSASASASSSGSGSSSPTVVGIIISYTGSSSSSGSTSPSTSPSSSGSSTVSSTASTSASVTTVADKLVSISSSASASATGSPSSSISPSGSASASVLFIKIHDTTSTSSASASTSSSPSSSSVTNDLVVYSTVTGTGSSSASASVSASVSSSKSAYASDSSLASSSSTHSARPTISYGLIFSEDSTPSSSASSSASSSGTVSSTAAASRTSFATFVSSEQSTATSTASNTGSSSSSVSVSESSSASASSNPSFTASPSVTASNSAESSVSASHSSISSVSSTQSSKATVTAGLYLSPDSTASSIPTESSTVTSTESSSPTASSTAEGTPTALVTATATRSADSSVSSTISSEPTVSAGLFLSQHATLSAIPTSSSSPSATGSATNSASDTGTQTSSGSATAHVSFTSTSTSKATMSVGVYTAESTTSSTASSSSSPSASSSTSGLSTLSSTYSSVPTLTEGIYTAPATATGSSSATSSSSGSSSITGSSSGSASVSASDSSTSLPISPSVDAPTPSSTKGSESINGTPSSSLSVSSSKTPIISASNTPYPSSTPTSSAYPVYLAVDPPLGKGPNSQSILTDTAYLRIPFSFSGFTPYISASDTSLSFQVSLYAFATYVQVPGEGLKVTRSAFTQTVQVPKVNVSSSGSGSGECVFDLSSGLGSELLTLYTDAYESISLRNGNKVLSIQLIANISFRSSTNSNGNFVRVSSPVTLVDARTGIIDILQPNLPGTVWYPGEYIEIQWKGTSMPENAKVSVQLIALDTSVSKDISNSNTTNPTIITAYEFVKDQSIPSGNTTIQSIRTRLVYENFRICTTTFDQIYRVQIIVTYSTDKTIIMTSSDIVLQEGLTILPNTVTTDQTSYSVCEGMMINWANIYRTKPDILDYLSTNNYLNSLMDNVFKVHLAPLLSSGSSNASIPGNSPSWTTDMALTMGLYNVSLRNIFSTNPNTVVTETMVKGKCSYKGMNRLYVTLYQNPGTVKDTKLSLPWFNISGTVTEASQIHHVCIPRTMVMIGSNDILFQTPSFPTLTVIAPYRDTSITPYSLPTRIVWRIGTINNIWRKGLLNYYDSDIVNNLDSSTVNRINSGLLLNDTILYANITIRTYVPVTIDGTVMTIAESIVSDGTVRLSNISTTILMNNLVMEQQYSWLPTENQWLTIKNNLNTNINGQNYLRTAQVCLSFTIPSVIQKIYRYSNSLTLPASLVYEKCSTSVPYFRMTPSSLQIVRLNTVDIEPYIFNNTVITNTNSLNTLPWYAGSKDFTIKWIYRGIDAENATFTIRLLSPLGKTYILARNVYRPVENMINDPYTIFHETTVSLPLQLPLFYSNWEIIIQHINNTVLTSCRTSTLNLCRPVTFPPVQFLSPGSTSSLAPYQPGNTLSIDLFMDPILAAYPDTIIDLDLYIYTGSMTETFVTRMGSVPVSLSSFDFLLPGTSLTGIYFLRVSSVTIPTLLLDSVPIRILATRKITIGSIGGGGVNNPVPIFPMYSGSILSVWYATMGIPSIASMKLLLLRRITGNRNQTETIISTNLLGTMYPIENTGVIMLPIPLQMPSLYNNETSNQVVWPVSDSNGYFVRVCTNEDTVSSFSPTCGDSELFPILPRSRVLLVTSPSNDATGVTLNTPLVWKKNENVVISWSIFGIPLQDTRVTIELYNSQYWAIGGDKLLTTITANTLASSSVYRWTVPDNLPSTLPVYIVISINGQGLWGRSQSFLINSLPLPNFRSFLEKVCYNDRSIEINIPDEFCSRSCYECQNVNGQWKVGTQISLSFDHLSLGNQVFLSNADTAALSSVLGSFTTSGLSICLPNTWNNPNTTINKLSLLNPYTVEIKTNYTEASRITKSLLPKAENPLAILTVKITDNNNLLGSTEDYVSQASSCPPDNRIIMRLSLSSEISILDMVAIISSIVNVSSKNIDISLIGPLTKSTGNGGNKNGNNRLLQERRLSDTVILTTEYEVQIRSPVTNFVISSSTNDLRNYIFTALSSSFSSSSSTISVSPIAFLSSNDQTTIDASCSSVYASESSVTPLVTSVSGSNNRPLVGSSSADLRTSAQEDGSADWSIKTLASRSLVTMGNTIRSIGLQLRVTMNALLNELSTDAIIGIVVAVIVITVISGILLFRKLRRDHTEVLKSLDEINRHDYNNNYGKKGIYSPKNGRIMQSRSPRNYRRTSIGTKDADDIVVGVNPMLRQRKMEKSPVVPASSKASSNDNHNHMRTLVMQTTDPYQMAIPINDFNVTNPIYKVNKSPYFDTADMTGMMIEPTRGASGKSHSSINNFMIATVSTAERKSTTVPPPTGALQLRSVPNSTVRSPKGKSHATVFGVLTGTAQSSNALSSSVLLPPLSTPSASGAPYSTMRSILPSSTAQQAFVLARRANPTALSKEIHFPDVDSSVSSEENTDSTDTDDQQDPYLAEEQIQAQDEFNFYNNNDYPNCPTGEVNYEDEEDSDNDNIASPVSSSYRLFYSNRTIRRNDDNNVDLDDAAGNRNNKDKGRTFFVPQRR